MTSESNFGFQKSFDTSSPLSLPINMSEVVNLNIPEKLPNISKNDLTKNNDNLVLNDEFISLINGDLQSLLNNVPIFSLPPLFNAQNRNNNDNSLDSSQFKYFPSSLPQQQPQQQPQPQQPQQPQPQQQQQQHIPFIFSQQQQQQQQQQPPPQPPPLVLKPQYCLQ